MKIKRNQKGIILIATLMMTVILTGITITLAVTPTGDLNNAANTQDQFFAQQAANGAIQEAQGWIQQKWNNSLTVPSGTCNYPSSLPMQANNLSLDNYPSQPNSWWSTNGCSASVKPSGAAQAPQYILKQLGCDVGNNQFIYHIIARAVGVKSTTVAFSEKIFIVGSNGNISGANSSTPGAKLVTFLGPSMDEIIEDNNGPWGWYKGSNPTWIPLGGQVLIELGGYPAWPAQSCACCCGGLPEYFGCQRDCSGRLRVYGSSTCNSHCPSTSHYPYCSTQYGPWVPASGGTSSINMCLDFNGTIGIQTFSCSQ